MSLEERALEILREHEDEIESDDGGVDEPELDEHVDDVCDTDDEEEVVPEPKAPLVSLPLCVDDEDDEDDDNGDDLCELIMNARYTQPLKGSPYVRKHDDILCMDVTSNIYYQNE
jgi:hypothetical protein